MNNKFNARLSFKGEGDLQFTLPIIGEITIWAGRDIYIKGATQEMIEYLRQYRSIRLDHKLNGDIKGCAKIIEVEDYINSNQSMFRATMMEKAQRVQKSSVSDLKSQMIKGDFTEEELSVVTEAGHPDAKKLQELEDEKNKKTDEQTGKDKSDKNYENDEQDDKKETKLPEELANYVVVTTKSKGKKFSELDERELRKLARYSTDSIEKENAKKAVEILYPTK